MIKEIITEKQKSKQSVTEPTNITPAPKRVYNEEITADTGMFNIDTGDNTEI